MRIKTTNNLRKEITALDLAIKMLRAENEGMRRSVVTLKKALNAPLALWESHWFDALPQHEQHLIDKTARTIADALVKPQTPVVVNAVTPAVKTSATPAKNKPATGLTPAPKTTARKRSTAPNATKPWTKQEDAKLLRMAGKEPNVHIADVLGRSVSACNQRYLILTKNKKKK